MSLTGSVAHLITCTKQSAKQRRSEMKKIALLVAILIIGFVLVSLAAGFETAVSGTRIAGEIAAQMLSCVR